MKKTGTGIIIAVCAAAVVLMAAAAVVAFVVLRVDPTEAQNIALSQTGGGEIVEQEISREMLWNEYSYTIVNGNRWYEIEIGGFGGIQEFESGTGNSYLY